MKLTSRKRNDSAGRPCRSRAKAMLSADVPPSAYLRKSAKMPKSSAKSAHQNRAQFANSLPTYESLYADEQRACRLLATEALEALHGMDEFAESVHALCANAEMEEVAHNLRTPGGGRSRRRADIDALESRAYALTQLKRKYGVTIEEVLQVKRKTAPFG